MHLTGVINESACPIILPESDFDPGADLVLYKHGMAKFEKLDVIRSYCKGR
jgi:saccharopine dehydrogenase-like NADP-dependent oxidoreductase